MTCLSTHKFVIHRIACDFVTISIEGTHCVEEAVFVGVGEEEGPGLAAVGGFVEAGEVAFAAAHDDGGVVVEGLNGAEVEVLAAGRFGAELPDEAGVLGAEDGAVGAGGPGDSATEVVDAAEVGGGGGLDGPLGLCGEEGGGEDEAQGGDAHRGKCIAERRLYAVRSKFLVLGF